MSRNTVERTDGCHVVSMIADPTVAIPKGAAVEMQADYQVTVYDNQSDFAQGVALEAHASGVRDCIPVLIPGPVIRVTAGEILAAGNLVTGDAAVPGEWIIDTGDPAAFALEAAGDGEEVDLCFIGEQY